MQARTVINQCYIIQEQIGEDGYCELWRATSVFAATEFLLRFLKPLPGLEERITTYRAEMMATYGISHPAVADVVEFEKFEERWFLASSYTGQKSLRSLYDRGISFGLEHLCRYVLELAQGVDAFHGLGIVYRCLNAENTLFQLQQGRVEGVQVQKPGYASLMDLLPEGENANWMETWSYVAPEAKREGEKVDQRADVYSLGVHLFRFLTGRLPFPEDTGFIRREAASLGHVAKALLRRGVPEALIRITLRALRPDPSRRYQDCVRFVADLRDFTDERRALWQKRNGIDPLANLETLNRAGGKIGASQIVRSLDTADYFRLLSEAPAEPIEAKPARAFPFTAFSDPRAVESLEKEEASRTDPGNLAEDDYIREARRAVSGEPWAVSEEEPLRDPALDQPEIGKVDETEIAEETEEGKGEELLGRVGKGPQGLALELPRARARAGEASGGSISWKGSSFHQSNLVETMETAFAKAKHGRGTLRFIEEPKSGAVAAALGRALGRFKTEALLVDCAAFPVQADATDLLRLLRLPLARSLGGENQRTTRLLSKRLSKTGGELVLASFPLGSALYGFDRPEPDPDFIDSSEGGALIARSILSFGRRTKPLVLVLRGGELVGPGAHRSLIELASLAPDSPLCCFIFFKRFDVVPSWHVLSNLDSILIPEAEILEAETGASASANHSVS